MQPKFLIGAVALVALGVFAVALLSRPASAPAPSPMAQQDQGGQSGSAAVSSTMVTQQAASSAPATQSYTLADVAQHGNAQSCWAAINGNVYDLTNWIYQHPGGPEHILAICGTDATAAFNAQHAGQSQPQQELKQFYIGVLAS